MFTFFKIGINDTKPSAPTPANESLDWLAKKYFDELSLQFRTSWDVYIKWYTVFLTTNVLAIAAVVQYVKLENRYYIVVAFSMQNVLALITAICIGCYSRTTAKRAAAIVELIGSPYVNSSSNKVLPATLSGSPLPGEFGLWSGIANALGNATLIFCWFSLLSVPSVTNEKAAIDNAPQRINVIVTSAAPTNTPPSPALTITILPSTESSNGFPR